ncbi:hypothetical protein [Zunongwangia sp. H14]|uniref:hypothetical protein n=1 Tax=Zunongwangia sp. H14 TaxID=3240792 RepID=UPI0035685DEF
MISEIYPFSLKEISEYQEKIDFEYLSKNKNVDWSYEIINEFKDRWNWNSLDQNRKVFRKLTLSLLFPGMTEVPECTCFRLEEFCENENCLVNAEKFSSASSIYNIYPQQFVRILMLIDSDFIDAEIIKDFYENQDSNIIKVDVQM